MILIDLYEKVIELADKFVTLDFFRPEYFKHLCDVINFSIFPALTKLKQICILRCKEDFECRLCINARTQQVSLLVLLVNLLIILLSLAIFKLYSYSFFLLLFCAECRTHNISQSI